MIDAMYNAVLFPRVRYHEKLSATAKLMFCEMTACVDENQMMDDNPDYFTNELHLPAADVQTAYQQLLECKLIIKQPQGQIWVDL